MCRQAMSAIEATVVLDFGYRDDGWHLLSGAVGRLAHAKLYSLPVKLDEVKPQVTAAHCP